MYYQRLRVFLQVFILILIDFQDVEVPLIVIGNRPPHLGNPMQIILIPLTIYCHLFYRIRNSLSFGLFSIKMHSWSLTANKRERSEFMAVGDQECLIGEDTKG